MSKRRTTSQIFGLSPEERTALINTVAGEAYQQGGGKDIAAVTANLLSRRLANYDGYNNIVDLVMAPKQYAANFTTSRDQIINPGLISAYDRERIGKIVDNPSMVLAEYIAGGGPVSFRGTELYHNRRGDEYTPIEGHSNFYFDPLKTQNPKAYQRGLDMFQGVVPATGFDQSPTQAAAAGIDTTKLPDGTVININYGSDGVATQVPTPETFITNYMMDNIFGGQGKPNINDVLMADFNKSLNNPITAEDAMKFFGGF